MTEADSGLGTPEPAADLDSILSSAIETHTPADTPAAEPAAEASPVADDAGRLRGPDGKFVAKPDSAAEAPDKGPAEVAATEPEPVVEPAPVQPIEPPARWTTEEKAKFAAWPRDVQEAVVERHKALEADYTRKTQEAADLRRTAEPILNAVKPYEGYLNQIAPRIGQTPDKMIANLIGVEYQLRTGDPHTKAQALYQIAAEYGIDLAALTRGEMPAAPDPAYTHLRQSFGNIEQQVTQLTSWFEQEQQRQAADQIRTFAAATDASGRPLHPHFERVRGVVGQVLRDEPTLTLDEAYKRAVAPIEEAIAAELKVRQEQATQANREAVEKAKKMAPPKVEAGAPNGSSKSKDLDSLLSDSINRHFA